MGAAPGLLPDSSQQVQGPDPHPQTQALGRKRDLSDLGSRLGTFCPLEADLAVLNMVTLEQCRTVLLKSRRASLVIHRARGGGLSECVINQKLPQGLLGNQIRLLFCFLFLLQHQTPKVSASLSSGTPRMTGTLSRPGPRPGTQKATSHALWLLEAQRSQLTWIECLHL